MWLTVPKPDPSAPLRLICLPYAGGGAAAYRPWTARLAGVSELAVVQLPGRESRFAEPAVDRLGALVPRLPSIVDERPYVLFGHSMGALIGFEWCRVLRAAGRPLPRVLVVSGRRAPHLTEPEPRMHDLPREEFVERLRWYGGTQTEVLGDPELLELFLPTLRADFALVETYAYRAEPPLDVPIVAYGGTGDPETKPSDVDAWAAQTSSDFRSAFFDGGHFFPFDGDEVLRDLVHVLDKASRPEPKSGP
jgi:medium-chain acyl-[acyl-carrier-protein] hydrolase